MLARQSQAGEPMNVRRIVTGRDGNGKSVLVEAGAPPRHRDYVAHPGFAETLVWATDLTPTLPQSGVDPTLSVTSFIPPPGGSRLLLVTLPPDAVALDRSFDGPAAFAEHRQFSPGITEAMEPDNPGMHITPTIDYVIVLEGEVWLELDDGREIQLRPTDIVIQNGTRHAWRNKSARTATIAAVLLGAAQP